MNDFGKPFSEEDHEILIKLHDQDKLSIIEISKKLNSSPNRIAYRLLECNYKVEDICGYIEYTKTEECNNYIKEVISIYGHQDQDQDQGQD